MKYFRVAALVLVVSSNGAVAQTEDHPRVDAMPEHYQARIEQRERSLRSLSPQSDGGAYDLVVETIRKWDPGETITVAFNGGDSVLHKKIADTAEEWTKHANLKFDFGYDSGSGRFRTWSYADVRYKASIRISFNDRGGYWSVVGTEATDPKIVGPHETSLHLRGFDVRLPVDWQGIVLHEFGHAIAAHHEHSHPKEGCDAEWRWDDDPGYIETKDSNGHFISDAQGRRPGLYTWFSGKPNEWPKTKVDFNLKQLKNELAYAFGDFDVNSVMKYYFSGWMFKNGQASRCFSAKNNALSEGDKRRVALEYPREENLVAKLLQQKQAIVSYAQDRLASLDRGMDQLREVLNTERVDRALSLRPF